jgi:hypothetical protein
MATLDEFESHLQSLLEVHLLKHLPGYKAVDGIAQQLATTMHAHLREENGATQAPNIYVIVGQPSTLTRWHARPRLLKELANTLYIAGMDAGFFFSTRPTVTTTDDMSIPAGELRVLASFSQESVGETLGINSGMKPGSTTGKIPSNAFLIVGGNQIVPLNRSVINIGRRLDNHIVIDDPRVSRVHAQLRIVRERFVIFDLNSSGGTFVNGERTDQSVLYPGDVISLAGVTVIFGQDLATGRLTNRGQTEPGPAFSGDRTTAVLEKNKDKNQ